MEGGAAARQNHAAHVTYLRRGHVQSAELGGAFLGTEPAAHRVADGARLLEDFLEHVVRVIALLDVGVGEFDFAQLIVARFAGDRTDLELIALDGDDVEIVQVNGVARVGDDRAHVAGQKIFVLADAEDEWAAATSADDEIWDIAMDECDSVGADDLP